MNDSYHTLFGENVAGFFQDVLHHKTEVQRIAEHNSQAPITQGTGLNNFELTLIIGRTYKTQGTETLRCESHKFVNFGRPITFAIEADIQNEERIDRRDSRQQNIFTVLLFLHSQRFTPRNIHNQTYGF